MSWLAAYPPCSFISSPASLLDMLGVESAGRRASRERWLALSGLPGTLESKTATFKKQPADGLAGELATGRQVGEPAGKRAG